LDNTEFIYLHQKDYFQWETYLAFLDQVLVPAFVFLRQACGAAKSQRDRLEAGLAQAPGSGPG